MLPQRRFPIPQDELAIESGVIFKGRQVLIPDSMTDAILKRPDEILTDNAPQYTGQAFKKFVTDWGMKHITSSPHYPMGSSKGMCDTSNQL